MLGFSRLLEWVECSSPEGKVPPARHGHGSVIHDGKLYLFGGMANAACDDFYAYEFASQLWTPVTTSKWRGNQGPCARHSHTCTLVGNSMIVYGGVSGDGTVLGDCFIFNFDKLLWTKVKIKGKDKSKEYPGERYGHAAASFEGLLCVHGGRDKNGVALGDVYTFDVSSKTWHTHEAPGGFCCPPRFDHSVVMYNLHLFVFGGSTDSDEALADCWLYDVGTGSWFLPEMQGTLPMARMAHCATVFREYMLVFGGFAPAEGNLSDLHALDLTTLTWGRIEACSVPRGRRHHSCMTSGSSVYVYGGIERAGARDVTSSPFVLGISLDELSLKTAMRESLDDEALQLAIQASLAADASIARSAEETLAEAEDGPPTVVSEDVSVSSFASSRNTTAEGDVPKVRFRLKLHGETRSITLARPALTFKSFMRKLNELYAPITLTYPKYMDPDEPDDPLTIRSDEDLTEAIEFIIDESQQKCVKIILQSAAESPSSEVPTGASSDVATAETLVMSRKSSLAPECEVEGLQWQKGQLLGKGAFGQVWMGMDLASGRLIAVKQMQQVAGNALRNEIDLLRSLCHEHIVQYLGCKVTEHSVEVYMEYVPGGSVTQLLRKFGPFPDAILRRYTLQLVTGLAYLHENQVVHRDIKGENVLVDDSGRIKLADFGASKFDTGCAGNQSFRGTPYFMAPEVVRQTVESWAAADIWSVGCTIFQMATGKAPWSHLTAVTAMFHIAKIKDGGSGEALGIDVPEVIASGDGGELFFACLRPVASERPSASDLLSFEYLDAEALSLSSPGPASVPPPVEAEIAEHLSALSLDFNPMTVGTVDWKEPPT